MIIAAAYKVMAGCVLTANRHSEFPTFLKRMGQSRMYAERQGFLTDGGSFLTREEARDHAKRHGQIPPDFHRVLTTEDLW